MSKIFIFLPYKRKSFKQINTMYYFPYSITSYSLAGKLIIKVENGIKFI